MTMSDVMALCIDLGIKATAGPHGVAFSWYFERSNVARTGRVRFRIECGSGIAGRGGVWGVVELPSGPRGPKVTTKRALRRQILEAIAEGSKPAPQLGRKPYARWHRTKHGDSVQWFTRNARRGGER